MKDLRKFLKKNKNFLIGGLVISIFFGIGIFSSNYILVLFCLIVLVFRLNKKEEINPRPPQKTPCSSSCPLQTFESEIKKFLEEEVDKKIS
jgi:hypothetical protein